VLIGVACLYHPTHPTHNPNVISNPQGCDPIDILLVKRDGRNSGEAYVLLGSAAHIQMAVEKNKSYLGRRYVEVFRAKKLVSGWNWEGGAVAKDQSIRAVEVWSASRVCFRPTSSEQGLWCLPLLTNNSQHHTQTGLLQSCHGGDARWHRHGPARAGAAAGDDDAARQLRRRIPDAGWCLRRVWGGAATRV